MVDPRNQWDRARERMVEGVEALLCFDHGLTGAELHGATSYILDDVVRPEFERALGVKFEELWSVRTIDQNFKEAIVQSQLSKAEAMALITRLNEVEYGKHWLQKV
jgi:hypothetical protein